MMRTMKSDEIVWVGGKTYKQVHQWTPITLLVFRQKKL